MKCKTLRCDICGRFISYQDIETKQARRSLVFPDNHFAPETYETFCSKCVLEVIRIEIEIPIQGIENND